MDKELIIRSINSGGRIGRTQQRLQTRGPLRDSSLMPEPAQVHQELFKTTKILQDPAQV